MENEIEDEIKKIIKKEAEEDKRILNSISEVLNDSAKNDEIRIRINKKDKEFLQEAAKKNYFETLSDYLRFAGYKCSTISSDGNILPFNHLSNDNNLKLESILRQIDCKLYQNVFYDKLVLVVNKYSEKQYLQNYFSDNIPVITIENYLNNSYDFSNNAVVFYPSVLLSFINENMNLRQDINLYKEQIKILNEKLDFNIKKYLYDDSCETIKENIDDILMFACNNDWEIEEDDQYNLKIINVITNKNDRIIYLFDKQKSKYYLKTFEYDSNNKYDEFKNYLLTIEKKSENDIEYLLKKLGCKLDEKIYLGAEKVKELCNYFENHEKNWKVTLNNDEYHFCGKDKFNNIDINSCDLSLNIVINMIAQIVPYENMIQYEIKINVKENNDISWNDHSDLKDFLDFLNNDFFFKNIANKIMPLANRKFTKLLSKKHRLNKSDYDYKLQMAIARKDIISTEKYIKKASCELITQLLNDAFTNNVSLYNTDNINMESFLKVLVRLMLNRKVKFDPYVAILYSINNNDLDLLNQIINLLKSGYKIKSDYFKNKIDLEKPLKNQMLDDVCQITIGSFILNLFEHGNDKDSVKFLKYLHNAGFILNLPLIFKSQIYTDEVINLFKLEFGSESFDIFNKKNENYLKNEDVDKIIEKINNGNIEMEDVNLLYEEPDEHEEDIESVEYQNNLFEKSSNKILKIRSNERSETIQKIIPLD